MVEDFNIIIGELFVIWPVLAYEDGPRLGPGPGLGPVPWLLYLVSRGT